MTERKTGRDDDEYETELQIAAVQPWAGEEAFGRIVGWAGSGHALTGVFGSVSGTPTSQLLFSGDSRNPRTPPPRSVAVARRVGAEWGGRPGGFVTERGADDLF
ncbi:MAG: hypothetical protein Q7V05_06990 [Methanoregula sp.]|nr:hypothetical protein [Methanoregula sp.]